MANEGEYSTVMPRSRFARRLEPMAASTALCPSCEARPEEGRAPQDDGSVPGNTAMTYLSWDECGAGVLACRRVGDFQDELSPYFPHCHGRSDPGRDFDQHGHGASTCSGDRASR